MTTGEPGQPTPEPAAERHLEQLEKQLDRTRAELRRVSVELERTRADLGGTLDSRSWKITAPLRLAAQKLRALQALRFRIRSRLGVRGARKRERERSDRLSQEARDLKRKYGREGSSETVDVIVPVYRGLEETRACLESVLAASQETPFELVVVNDGTPDPQLSTYLDRLASSGRVTLVTNRENLGFVRSANIGMALHPTRDVVLLNSDTEVANDWLDRLRRCAHSDPRTGTVTPFSNNATICSYPDPSKANFVPLELSVSELDGIFRRVNAGEAVSLPTAVGFCMYIRRDCLEDVGFFDDGTFGRGYGEENDLCLRASARGWKHMLACNVFVMHIGELSFAEEGTRLSEGAQPAIAEIHPGYPHLIRAHVDADPARTHRLNVDIERVRATGLPVVVFITHGRGGGTDRHIRDLIAAFGDRAEFLRLSPSARESRALDLIREHSGERINIPRGGRSGSDTIASIFERMGTRRFHFHHLIDLPPDVLNLPAELSVPYDFTPHDMYAYCPQITLTTVAGAYCGEPDESGCNRCLRGRPAPGKVSIEVWRDSMRKFVDGADRVLCPTASLARRFHRHFPNARLMVASPSEFDEMVQHPLGPVYAGVPMLRVAVLGALSAEKGADVLEAAAVDARSRRLPLEFHLFGYAFRELAQEPRAALIVHGRYNDAELLEMIAGVDPHVVWFPARWPETYSYTLSSALASGLPIVATDLGALPERLAGRPHAWVLDWRTTPQEWNAFFSSLQGGAPASQRVRSAWAPDVDIPLMSYSEDYLSPLVPKAQAQ